MKFNGAKSLVFILGVGCASAMQAHGQTCSQTVFYNGVIVTMDARNTVARSVTVGGERITSVGMNPGIPKHIRCAALIDLKGRTVVPGLIDSHNHVVVTSLRPGHDVRLDLPASIAEVQGEIGAKAATVGSGEWITSVGGWTPEQFAEKRMPTQAELDAASPANPVYLQTGFEGPAATNSKGRAIFAAGGIAVGDRGEIAANGPTQAAYDLLVSRQTAADKRRGTLDVMAYAARLGLTMSDDKGGTWPTTVRGWKGLAETGDRTNNLDPVTGYDQFRQLDREGKMAMRLRIFFYMQDTSAGLPFLQARLTEGRDAGDDWLRTAGIGERVYSGGFPFVPNSSPAIYESAARLVAENGWAYDQHGMALSDEKAFTAVWEEINRTTPLAPLRWCLAHVPGIDAETVERLRAMGVGVSAAGSRYAASTPPRAAPKDIPPFRMLVQSGIHVGYGSDGGTVSSLNPWPHMYYMVTGKNSAGQVVAEGQTLSRLEALRMYTARQPWFTKDEELLGSIEQGKLADIVVLSEDFLDPIQVPDDRIKQIHSVLTLIGGKIVYDAGKLRGTPRTGR